MTAIKTRKYLLINLAITLAMFIISVIVRWDNLQEPMGRHHEWLTAHVLCSNSIYEKGGGPSKFHFASVLTFDNYADRQSGSLSSLKDKNNFAYYVSYPPMCFVLPYYAVKLTGAKISVPAIRTVNLFVNLAIIVMLTILVFSIFNKSLFQVIFVPAHIAAFLYLFANGNLWFHGHVFFADTLVPLFIVAFLFYFHRLISKKENSIKQSLPLFIFSLLGALTEWQMLFLSFAGVIFLGIKFLKNKKTIIPILSICLGTLLGLTITIVLYSQIAGFDNLIDALVFKYKQRSGTDSIMAEAGFSIYNSFSYENLSNHFENNYKDLLDFSWYLLLLLPFAFVLNRSKNLMDRDHSRTSIVFILFLSIVLHYIVFFNFSVVHDFSTLKSSLLMTLMSAISLAWILSYSSVFKPSGKIIVYLILLGVLGFYFHKSTAQYYSYNHRWKTNKSPVLMGEIVKKYADDSTLVFSSEPPTPEIMYYAQRSVNSVPDINGAKNYASQLPQVKKSVFISFQYEHVDLFYFNNQGDSLNSTFIPYNQLESMKMFD